MKYFLWGVLFTFFLAGPATAAPRMLILGDSLTEGYGIGKQDAYPALLEAKFKKSGKDVEVVNGGSSGATTASGVPRLKWYLKEKFQWVVVALGANDGLRGINLGATEKNLDETIALAKSKGAKVIVLGMKIPPNYGASYAADFEAVFKKVTKKAEVPLIPFMLEGVAANPALNQEDGIHPNEKGHQKMAEFLFPKLLKLINL